MEKERIFYNQENQENHALNFVKNHDVFNKELFIDIAKLSDYEEFCDMCAAMDMFSFSRCFTSWGEISYEDEREVRNALNERVNEILGEYAEVFNILRESQGHEYWNGDNRYKLFGHSFGEYADMQVMKSLVRYVVELEGKPFSMELMKVANHIYKSGDYWDLYPETRNYMYDINVDEEFETINEWRKKNVIAWETFLKLIYEKNFEEAHKIIIEYNNQNLIAMKERK